MLISKALDLSNAPTTIEKQLNALLVTHDHAPTAYNGRNDRIEARGDTSMSFFSPQQNLKTHASTTGHEQINTGRALEMWQKTRNTSQINRFPWPSTAYLSTKQDSTTKYEIHHENPH